ncbi:hypothetical protein ACPOL_3799 [Acidisarcina polymorpha]|uniref:Uncharacterized protein n=1 Tax=Acidisarcina polymorpha TaxID=2211140 RepID=A0A2Z5G1X8_9BACT|nr:hypothetical protein [Acidisarcina polymorpha]AXC13078.1 hypothetical protein ACPOL_3799 [Acidisarcina polymorpha]
MVRILVRGLTAALIVGGMLAAGHIQVNSVTRQLQFKTASEGMPVPACPPNDVNACNIDTW